MKQENYNDFSKEQVNARNTHDLKVMSHYNENLEFSSPIIQQMGVNENGTITNKEVLKDYFGRTLQKYPDLKFELLHILKRVNSLVLFYKYIVFTGISRDCNTSNSLPTFINAAMALSRCCCVCAALSCTRILAFPFGTTGKKNPIT